LSAPLAAEELALLGALRSLRFGVVEAVVHDGRIVRIERTEKLRFGPDPDPGGPPTDESNPRSTRPHRRSSPRTPRGEAP
jgi:hypothetical protein